MSAPDAATRPDALAATVSPFRQNRILSVGWGNNGSFPAGRTGNLLGEHRKLLGLLGQRLELPAGIFGRQLFERRRRIHRAHLLDKIEGRIDVIVSKFDELVVVVLNALKCRRGSEMVFGVAKAANIKVD
jgi:hypothetical protein